MKFMKTKQILQSIFCGLFLFSISAAGQSGGVFEITGAVIASGGEPAANGVFTVNKTIGQPWVGESSGGGFITRGGFWTPQIAPTSAAVSIRGRILTAEGNGIVNVIISLTDPSTGATISTRSSSFGYFRFDEIAVGQTYILIVSSKRFTFIPNSRVIMPTDEVTDAHFTALPEN